MADTGRKLFIPYNRMRARLRGMSNLNHISLIIIKNLFGAPEEENFTMDESRTDDIPQVSDEENSLLTAPYSEEEVRKAVFLMEHNNTTRENIIHRTLAAAHVKKACKR